MKIKIWFWLIVIQLCFGWLVIEVVTTAKADTILEQLRYWQWGVETVTLMVLICIDVFICATVIVCFKEDE